MSDTPRTMWESLTEDERAVIEHIAKNGFIWADSRRHEPAMDTLLTLEYIDCGHTEEHRRPFYYLLWRGFRIIPQKVAAEIDASLNTSASQP